MGQETHVSYIFAVKHLESSALGERSGKSGKINFKRLNEFVTNRLQNTFCLSTYKRLLQVAILREQKYKGL
jgi:hypothetical protein